MNRPLPDPTGETARLIVALAQIASDAGKCVAELRNPNQPWVTGAVVGIRNDAIAVTERCSAWLKERKKAKPESKQVPSADEYRANKKAERELKAIRREDAKRKGAA